MQSRYTFPSLARPVAASAIVIAGLPFHRSECPPPSRLHSGPSRRHAAYHTPATLQSVAEVKKHVNVGYASAHAIPLAAA